MIDGWDIALNAAKWSRNGERAMPMRRNGRARRLFQWRPHALRVTLLPLVLVLALPACQSTTVCNAAAALILAPALTAADGAVYAATDGTVTALRAGTGALVWHSSAGGVLAGHPTPPMVTGDAVIASTGPGALVARRVSGGALIWHSQPVPRPQSGYNPPLPVLTTAGDAVYAAASPDSIAAWRIADGTLLWQSPPLALPADPAYTSSYPPVPEPVVAAGVVYFSAGRAVHAVSAADGSLLWSSPALQLWSFYTPPVLADGRVFIVAHDGSLYALRAESGAVLWHAPNPDAASFPAATSVAAPPVVRDGVVYYAAVNGTRALAADTGKLLWHLTFDNPNAGPAPVIADGVAYIAAGGILRALDARTGAARWQIAMQQATEAPFLVNGDAVYTMSPSMVAAWSSSNGASIWQRTVQSDPASLQQVVFAGGALYLSTNGMTGCGNSVLPTVAALRAADGALLWHTSVSVTPA